MRSRHTLFLCLSLSLETFLSLDFVFKRCSCHLWRALALSHCIYVLSIVDKNKLSAGSRRFCSSRKQMIVNHLKMFQIRVCARFRFFIYIDRVHKLANPRVCVSSASASRAHSVCALKTCTHDISTCHLCLLVVGADVAVVHIHWVRADITGESSDANRTKRDRSAFYFVIYFMTFFFTFDCFSNIKMHFISFRRFISLIDLSFCSLLSNVGNFENYFRSMSKVVNQEEEKELSKFKSSKLIFR